jgi:hypothetical protein
MAHLVGIVGDYVVVLTYSLGFPSTSAIHPGLAREKGKETKRGGRRDGKKRSGEKEGKIIKERTIEI